MIRRGTSGLVEEGYRLGGSQDKISDILKFNFVIRRDNYKNDKIKKCVKSFRTIPYSFYFPLISISKKTPNYLLNHQFITLTWEAFNLSI